MAEAFGRHYFGRSVYFASAGVRQGELDPLAAEVMDEIGIDIAKYRPQTFEDLEDASFDLIVSLSPEAHHKALEFTRALATHVVYWPTLDPSAVEGARAHMLDAYRSVRDALAARIKVFFPRGPPPCRSGGKRSRGNGFETCAGLKAPAVAAALRSGKCIHGHAPIAGAAEFRAARRGLGP